MKIDGGFVSVYEDRVGNRLLSCMPSWSSVFLGYEVCLGIRCLFVKIVVELAFDCEGCLGIRVCL